MRLRAYIWPEHKVRFARMDAAIAAATALPPKIAHMAAADFVDQQLALPQAAGTTRLLFHSIVWQYLPASEQALDIFSIIKLFTHILINKTSP